MSQDELQAIPSWEEAVKQTLKKYGLCKCGRQKDSPNFAYHICVEQGLLFDLNSAVKELVQASKPEKQERSHRYDKSSDWHWKDGYNQALDIYQANIIKAIEGKS